MWKRILATTLRPTAIVAVLFMISYGADAKPRFTTLYSFAANGLGPGAQLVRSGDGNLFGTTLNGGDDNAGVVFELDTSGVEHVLRTFCAACSRGANPGGNLIIDASGDLYGTTYFGGDNSGGTVFELIPSGTRKQWKFVLLHSFCEKANCKAGYEPTGLTYQGAQSGAPYDGISPLYGTTYNGGRHAGGVAFMLTFQPGRRKPNYRVIYNFCSRANCNDGANPDNGLIADGSGNLFGTALAGGMNNVYGGTVFELSPHGTDFSQTVLYAFCRLPGCTDGFSPGPLIMDKDNRLVGVTRNGGPGGSGVIFRIAPNRTASKEEMLYGFCSLPECADGFAPSGIAMDAKGDLLATTTNGGAKLLGTLLAVHHGKATILHTFCSVPPSCSDGAQPSSSPIVDPLGNIYGTTEDGGSESYPYGTIFRLTH